MNKYLEKQFKLYEKVSEIECIEEILDNLNELYCEGKENFKKLPSELNKYAGNISIIYTLSLILKEKLKNNKEQ